MKYYDGEEYVYNDGYNSKDMRVIGYKNEKEIEIEVFGSYEYTEQNICLGKEQSYELIVALIEMYNKLYNEKLNLKTRNKCL